MLLLALITHCKPQIVENKCLLKTEKKSEPTFLTRIAIIAIIPQHIFTSIDQSANSTISTQNSEKQITYSNSLADLQQLSQGVCKKNFSLSSFKSRFTSWTPFWIPIYCQAQLQQQISRSVALATCALEIHKYPCCGHNLGEKTKNRTQMCPFLANYTVFCLKFTVTRILNTNCYLFDSNMHDKPCDTIASEQNTTCFNFDLLYKNKDASCEWHCQTKFIARIKRITIAESNELFDNQFTHHFQDKMGLLVTCDSNRLIIGLIDTSEL